MKPSTRLHDVQRAWVLQVLGSAQQRGFFGTITIKMEQGAIKRVLKEESLMPPEVETSRGVT